METNKWIDKRKQQKIPNILLFFVATLSFTERPGPVRHGIVLSSLDDIVARDKLRIDDGTPWGNGARLLLPRQPTSQSLCELPYAIAIKQPRNTSYLLTKRHVLSLLWVTIDNRLQTSLWCFLCLAFNNPHTYTTSQIGGVNMGRIGCKCRHLLE